MKLRICLLTIAVAAALSAAHKAVERVDKAAEVLTEVMGTREKAIPSDLLSKAHCVAIVPGVKKVGLGLGAKYGKGVIVCRGAGGNGWTGPSTVRIEGGSIGFQIGGSSTDVVLLVMNKKGKDKLLASKVTLGAEAAVAGGPVGRSAQAQTDAQMHAEILSYSRSRGAFAGISLEGATLRPDNKDNKAIYGKDVTPKDILSGKVPGPASTKALSAALTKYSAKEH
jgi:lipid-binding SYLF domain-containing protein